MGKPRLGDVIGFRADGRQICLIGGGSEDEGHPSEGDEQTPDDDDAGEDESGTVLDPDGGDESGETPPAVDTDAIVTALEEKLGARFDAIADKRVNAILKEVRKQKPPAGTDDQGGSPNGEPAPDARVARLAFREYVTDDLTFLAADERQFAMSFGAGLLAQNLKPGSDEDEVGRLVAVEVASQVKALRKFYEKRTIAGLKKRGALKETPGQPGKTPPNVGGASEFEKGKALAESMYGTPE